MSKIVLRSTEPALSGKSLGAWSRRLSFAEAWRRTPEANLLGLGLVDSEIYRAQGPRHQRPTGLRFTDQGCGFLRLGAKLRSSPAARLYSRCILGAQTK